MGRAYLCIFFLFFNQLAIACQGNEVVVEGFAQSFILDSVISGATIKVENFEKPDLNQEVKTDKKGHFSFCSLPGYHLTLTLAHPSINPLKNYIATQSATILVPPSGLIGHQLNIGFQVPRVATFYLLKEIISTLRWLYMDNNECQLATTVRAKGKTLEDDIQGVKGAVVTINGVPANTTTGYWPWTKPFYFNILLTKTWPFSSAKTKTSDDGGVLIYNLPASDSLYQLSAQKKGMKFSTVEVFCKAGAFINAAPPHSPSQL